MLFKLDFGSKLILRMSLKRLAWMAFALLLDDLKFKSWWCHSRLWLKGKGPKLAVRTGWEGSRTLSIPVRTLLHPDKKWVERKGVSTLMVQVFEFEGKYISTNVAWINELKDNYKMLHVDTNETLCWTHNIIQYKQITTSHAKKKKSILLLENNIIFKEWLRPSLCSSIQVFK